MDYRIANLYGCIPNTETPESVATIQESAVPWDATTQPPVTSWSSFETFLKEQPDQRMNWWEDCNVESLFTASQSYRPNCAGFSEANAALTSIINQRVNRYSEHLPKRFNPMVTWQKSKGGSVFGGQSISAMAIAGNEYGNYLAEDVGEYDPAKTFSSTQNDEDSHAQSHQIGYTLYDGEAPWDAILLACKKGYSCFVGNSRAVDDCEKDSNGVMVATLSGSWSHATAFAGYKVVNNTEYVFWINSHGNIYKGEDGTPDFGCWMSYNTLKSFMSSSFNDLCVITYCEAGYDPDFPTTLNPEA